MAEARREAGNSESRQPNTATEFNSPNVEQVTESSEQAKGEHGESGAESLTQQMREAIEEAAEPNFTQSELAEIGEMLLSAGIMPRGKYFTALNIDKPRARGYQSVMRMALEDSPARQQAAEIMAQISRAVDAIPTARGRIGRLNDQNLVEHIFRDPARFRDLVSIIPPIKGDAITHRSLFNNLAKSDIGLETLEYILGGKCSIEISYTNDAPQGERAYTTGYSIVIFAKNTSTIKETARTLIHEVTHAKYRIGGSQYAEVICFAREHIHEHGELTYKDMRDIIKTVRELYPEYNWRSGGRNEWKK